jgi:hypothetical protein
MFFRRKPAPPPAPTTREMTLAELAPADVININGSMLIVENVLECSEDMGARITGWRWTLLEDGQLLEVETGSQLLYQASVLARQGSEIFDQLVADDGILKTFEARVREHGAAHGVTFQLQDQVYSVQSTGTFAAKPVGAAPTQEVWRDLSPTQGENVYFKMEAADGALLLGVWTTHIALHQGRPLSQPEILGLYPGSEGK